MRQNTLINLGLCCFMLLLAVSSAPITAQEARSEGLYGDWNVKITFNQRQMESILDFSQNPHGDPNGQWISLWGVSELKDLTYEPDTGTLSFTHERRNRQGKTTTSKFTGAIKEDKLSGTLSSDRGTYQLEGQRAPRLPRAVGTWQLFLDITERFIVPTLTINIDSKGKLSAHWQSPRGEHEVTDVEYEGETLTVKRHSKYQSLEWDSTLEATIDPEGKLTGELKSQWGPIDVDGDRLGAKAIGTWNLQLVPEGTPDPNRPQRIRQQRLRVNPDMSGLYGTVPVKEIKLDGAKMSFEMVLEFDERKIEMKFNAELSEGKLTGKLVTPRGVQLVTATKVAPPSR